jgi:tetratricopeptide (TPR) repeat protein
MKARRNNMNASLSKKSSIIALVVATVLLGTASIAHAQLPATGTNTGVSNQTMVGNTGGTMNDQLSYGSMGHQTEREQLSAFQAFSKESNAAKKIEKGREFLRKYPKSPFEEQVDASLMDTYRTQADWANEYHFADQALALNPNDVDVLATVGWTIPHVYQPTDPDANEELDKAEKYAKRAIETLATIPKPHDMTDAQFAAAKAKRTYQAHSALGLVYFRRQDFEGSATELEQATKGNPVQDQTDLFVLGADLQNLNRFSEAGEAFGRCSQILGPLQNQCKQNEQTAKTQADQSKSR